MNVLEVQGLTKRYPAFTLNGVSFDVPQGAVMGFIGRNGAGKSTTLKSILGMVHPDAGAVRVFGMDYAENERAIRRELGVVLGGIDFYPKKKIKTITDVTRRFYNNWDEEKYRHYLELFHIDESKRVDQLSSGMKVKYMIALALSHNARLLILDEPTSGLDPAGAVLFRKIIEEERQKGTTVFLTTHNMLDADLLCDRVAFITNGNIVALDTPQNLKEKNSNHRIVVSYLYQGKRKEQTIEAPELKAGIPFAYDEIISIHSQEPTLADVFIQYTGRGLS